VRSGLGSLIVAFSLAFASISRAQEDAELPEETSEEAAPGDAQPAPDAALPDELAEEPTQSEESPEEPARVDTWTWPGTVLTEFQARVAVPLQTDFDRALAAHGFGTRQIAPAIVLGVQFPIGVEWLWLGGRLGARGRTWDHAYKDEDAALVGLDLLATVRARLRIGSVVELGIMVAGGVGYLGLSYGGVMIDQIAPRFDVGAELAFAVGRHFTIGPRFGWEYFQWSDINVYAHGLDAGGPWLGAAIEGRE
jgi:hypothetical protein